MKGQCALELARHCCFAHTAVTLDVCSDNMQLRSDCQGATFAKVLRLPRCYVCQGAMFEGISIVFWICWYFIRRDMLSSLWSILMAPLAQHTWHMVEGGSSTRAGDLRKTEWHRPGALGQAATAMPNGTSKA